MKAVKCIMAIFAAAVLCLTLDSCGSYEVAFPAYYDGYYTGGYYYGSYYYCPPPPPPPHHHHHW